MSQKISVKPRTYRYASWRASEFSEIKRRIHKPTFVCVSAAITIKIRPSKCRELSGQQASNCCREYRLCTGKISFATAVDDEDAMEICVNSWQGTIDIQAQVSATQSRLVIVLQCEATCRQHLGRVVGVAIRDNQRSPATRHALC